MSIEHAIAEAAKATRPEADGRDIETAVRIGYAIARADAGLGATLIPVTYDQDEFRRASQAVDWGVLVTDGQEGLSVYVCAESPENAARHLRDAAAAIEGVGRS